LYAVFEKLLTTRTVKPSSKHKAQKLQEISNITHSSSKASLKSAFILSHITGNWHMAEQNTCGYPLLASICQGFEKLIPVGKSIFNNTVHIISKLYSIKNQAEEH